MKTRSIFQALCVYSFMALGNLCLSQMSIAKIESNDLRDQRSLFKRCWYSIYQDCSLKQLGFANLSKLVHENFDKEERDYAIKASNRLFFNAVQNNQVIGYISFDVKKGHAVYIKQIALLPDFCTVDSLRELIFVVFDHVSDVSCVHMTLHRQAKDYKDMATELGFVATPGSEKALSVHLRMQFNKCGTCLCDFDYEQNQDETDDGFFLDDDIPSENDQYCESLNGQ